MMIPTSNEIIEEQGKEVDKALLEIFKRRRYQLVDFENVTFEIDANDMVIGLYFRVNDKRVNNCELEKATGMSIDELILKMVDGSLNVIEKGE